MKKDLGPVLALYPMPLVIVGAMVGEKPNWLLAGHVGILGHDRVMVSLAKPHYTNRGIREAKCLSINMVDAPLLQKADYVGGESGAKTDKSGVFPYTLSESGAPILDDSKLSMECLLEDIYETPGFDNFILTIRRTLADEAIINGSGKPDYAQFKPILLEMPGYTYVSTGRTVAKCLSLGRELK